MRYNSVINEFLSDETMIGMIKGTVVELIAPTVCVLTASGVGYDIELPLPDFCQLQLHHDCTIWTHLHVREDAQLLYGFMAKEKRAVFRQLIRINGVGAKMALAIMSTFEPSELKHCVAQHDESALVRVPGVGKKTAQRLLIELKDKLEHIETDTNLILLDNQNGSSGTSAQVNNDILIISEVESALISLGYREKEAQQAIKLARNSVDESVFSDTQTLLKLTLKQLSGF